MTEKSGHPFKGPGSRHGVRFREYLPGDSRCVSGEDGQAVGERWYTTYGYDPNASGGAAEALVPHDPYGEGSAPRRMPKSLSGKY